MPSVYIEVYGCSNSQAEAEIMAGLLEKAGFGIVKSEKDADLLIIVTCYVKSPTEQKILFRIKQLSDVYPKKNMIVAGCMPEGMYETVLEANPHASLVSTHHVKEIANAAKKTLEGKRVEFLGKSEEVKVCLPKVRKNKIIDIVPISSGCNSSCAYCCVRLSKGRLFSFPQDLIVKEVENSIRQGCKEIWLTSQDNASYGMDIGTGLPQLLQRISKIEGRFMVRSGMANPKNVLTILDPLVKAYQSERIFKFLHLPIQSGDDSVLKNMNRGYNVSEFLGIVSTFKKIHSINLWTDVIVGLPGETEEQYENTVKAIEKVRPDWTNVSKFGLRPGTSFEKLGFVPSKIISKRSEEMSKLTKQISLEKNQEWVGKECIVLVSKKGKLPNQWLGRNENYKLVMLKNSENLLGRFLNVEIKEAANSHLLGSIL